MADPLAARANQLRNIEAKTGQSFTQLRALIAASGLTKVGEQRTMLMQGLGLGYGDANALALMAQDAAQTPPPADADPLNAIYAGNKAGLRPLHDQVMAAISALGEFEIATKKSYVSLRRKKQFAMLGPATATQLALGLNLKPVPPSLRLKAQPPASMCPCIVRLGSPAEIDAELLAWVRSAFDAAA